MNEEQLQFDIFEKPRIVACDCDTVKGMTHYALIKEETQ